MSAKRARYAPLTSDSTVAVRVRDEWDDAFVGLDSWELTRLPVAPDPTDLFEREARRIDVERGAALMAETDGASITPLPPNAASVRLSLPVVPVEAQATTAAAAAAAAAPVVAPTAPAASAVHEDELEDSDDGVAAGACPLCGKPLKAFAKGAKAHLATCAAALMDEGDWT